jgi:hypothetical protein
VPNLNNLILREISDKVATKYQTKPVANNGKNIYEQIAFTSK